VGRYREGGPALIRLSGQVNQQEQTFTHEGFFENSGGERFIPRLWATRKIGYLLNQIRLHGESRELVDEIVQLSIRYGIVTPYTSYLVQEEADVLTREGRQIIVEEEFNTFSAVPQAVAGEEAVLEAEAKAAIQSADLAEAPAAEVAEVVKIVGDKTFVFRDGVWTDTTFDPSQGTTQKVGFGGEAYFDLLAARPDMGAYFSLGERVIVVVGDAAYEVAEADSGTIDLPPVLTSEPTPVAGKATPTPGVVAAIPTPTPATSARSEPPSAPQAQSGESQSGGLGGLCPGTLLPGLVLLPLAAVGFRRRRDR